MHHLKLIPLMLWMNTMMMMKEAAWLLLKKRTYAA
jgi:hypothetical protein